MLKKNKKRFMSGHLVTVREGAQSVEHGGRK
jgi:hypothetical protein